MTLRAHISKNLPKPVYRLPAFGAAVAFIREFVYDDLFLPTTPKDLESIGQFCRAVMAGSLPD
jgi:hypothetical protein